MIVAVATRFEHRVVSYTKFIAGNTNYAGNTVYKLKGYKLCRGWVLICSILIPAAMKEWLWEVFTQCQKSTTPVLCYVEFIVEFSWKYDELRHSIWRELPHFQKKKIMRLLFMFWSVSKFATIFMLYHFKVLIFNRH